VRLRRDIEIDLDAVNVRPLHIRDANADTGQPERRRQSLEPRFIKSDVDESAEEHVAGDAAGGVEDCDFHLMTWGKELPPIIRN
jgi:hypothetical protein